LSEKTQAISTRFSRKNGEFPHEKPPKTSPETCPKTSRRPTERNGADYPIADLLARLPQEQKAAISAGQFSGFPR